MLSRSTAPTSPSAAVGAGSALHRLGGRARQAAQPREPTSASSISSARPLLGARCRGPRAGLTRQVRAFAHASSSSSPRRSRPRAWRTPPSIATTAWSSLNEVGGDPRRFGVHGGGLPRRQPGPRQRTGRTRCWPPPPTTTSARRTCARASTCCPRCPPRGGCACAAGAASTAARRSRWTTCRRLRANDEYLLYQTLLGTWPLDAAGRRARSPPIASASRHT